MSGSERGYVLFQCEREEVQPGHVRLSRALASWRDRLRRLGLVGVGADGIGYGNLSVRLPRGDRFLITGTATGGLDRLGREHVVEVVAWDFAANRVRCRGLRDASSESLSHAAVYVADPTARAVIHVHHRELWERLRHRAPTTGAAADAGTPEMAYAITDLLRDRAVKETGLFVMGGHPEGLIAFGVTPERAWERLERALGAVTEREPSGT